MSPLASIFLFLLCVSIVINIGFIINHRTLSRKYEEKIEAQKDRVKMYQGLYVTSSNEQEKLRAQMQEMSLSAKDQEMVNKEIASAKELYEQVSIDYNILSEKLRIKNKNYDDLEAKYIQKTNDIILLENKKDELNSIISQAQDINREVVNKGNELAARLAALQSTHRAVMKEMATSEDGSEDYGGGMNLSIAEDKILETVDELTKLCPELASDLAAIKWKRIWLPKIQALAGQEALDGRSGIYKLTLRSNPQICYVGQAVNIKERGYTHIKKMLGVESKGKERLYNNEYAPDDFYGGVIEFVDDRNQLNEKEKYWIDYYSCTEYGLNSKKGN